MLEDTHIRSRMIVCGQQAQPLIPRRKIRQAILGLTLGFKSQTKLTQIGNVAIIYLWENVLSGYIENLKLIFLFLKAVKTWKS